MATATGRHRALLDRGGEGRGGIDGAGRGGREGAWRAVVRTRPHYLDEHRLVVRTGHLTAVTVDLADVRAARHDVHDAYSGDRYRSLVTVTDDWVAVTGMVGTVLTLDPDSPVTVPARGTVRTGRLRFDADEPRAALAAITARLRRDDGPRAKIRATGQRRADLPVWARLRGSCRAPGGAGHAAVRCSWGLMP